MKKTLRFAIRLSPDYAMFNILTLYPGTRLYEDARQSGLIPGDPWAGFAEHPTPDFSPPIWDAWLSRTQLAALQAKAYRSFYWRPKVLFHQLFLSGGFRSFWRKLRVGLSMIRPGSGCPKR